MSGIRRDLLSDRETFDVVEAIVMDADHQRLVALAEIIYAGPDGPEASHSSAAGRGYDPNDPTTWDIDADGRPGPSWGEPTPAMLVGD